MSDPYIHGSFSKCLPLVDGRVQAGFVNGCPQSAATTAEQRLQLCTPLLQSFGQQHDPIPERASRSLGNEHRGRAASTPRLSSTSQTSNREICTTTAKGSQSSVATSTGISGAEAEADAGVSKGAREVSTAVKGRAHRGLDTQALAQQHRRRRRGSLQCCVRGGRGVGDWEFRQRIARDRRGGSTGQRRGFGDSRRTRLARLGTGPDMGVACMQAGAMAPVLRFAFITRGVRLEESTLELHWRAGAQKNGSTGSAKRIFEILLSMLSQCLRLAPGKIQPQMMIQSFKLGEPLSRRAAPGGKKARERMLTWQKCGSKRISVLAPPVRAGWNRLEQIMLGGAQIRQNLMGNQQWDHHPNIWCILVGKDPPPLAPMDDDLEFLFSDEPPLDPDDSEAHIGNEPDDITLQEEDIPGKVRTVLKTIRDEGLDLAIFLDAVCWGNKGCISDSEIQFARTGLMVSDELPGILRRCYNPPRRAHKAKGKRPAGAHRVLQDFATECVSDAIHREIVTSAFLFFSPPEELSEKHLTSLNFEELRNKTQIHCPILWLLLRRAAYTPEQETRTNIKILIWQVILHMISQIQFTRSNQCGRVTKLWSIYLKACGLSARAFDTLHALGILMSHKWTANAYGTLSDCAIAEVRALIHLLPWIISHDNLNVALRVFSQRLNNQSHFITLPPDMNRAFQLFRAQNCGTVFGYASVLYGNEEADNWLEAFDQNHVLQLLLNSPDFSDYPHCSDPLLLPPPPVHQLQGGLKNRIKMFILKTSTFEESSYEGTLNVMDDAFQQLNLNSADEQTRTSLERLTIERLCGLWKYRHEDHNSFDRMDYMIPVFGWFHLVMAFANSIHKQYLGTSEQIGGLRQAFDVLKRKGLISQSTKGPFWHHLDEALHHISEAHFRASWLDVGGVKNLADLKIRSPQELRELAAKLIRLHASREALNRVDWWIEDLLPTILFRFAGGGNPKYTIEILELFQGLKREWPEKLRYYITEFCWLMTRTGTVDSWLAFDLGQEENICDIKVNYRSMGPAATMEYMGKVSPTIPALRKVQRHMEQQFHTNKHGARHGVPDKEKDVAKLITHYVTSKLHTFEGSQKLKKAGSEDYITVGADNLERLKTIEKWFERCSHARQTGKDWSDDQDSILLEPLLGSGVPNWLWKKISAGGK
ncbi:hypothetical protein B0H14DRAFT_2574605 [Mycena olivaceomarginata]|nr:hypothetical protein B0H14DRAFT_2574605 [Mycena olivaceomarginata]